MDFELLQEEVQEYMSLFDAEEGLDPLDVDANVVFQHTTKNMIPSELTTPNDKYNKRTKDIESQSKEYKPLTKNEPRITSDGKYQSVQFVEAANRYFDNTDEETRKVLLAVNEADQNRILTALTSKIYDSIINKVDQIDFGDIPSTKGDFTKLPKYNQLVACNEAIKELVLGYGIKDVEAVDTVLTAIQNLVSNADLFTRAYRYNSELPIVVYNTIALSTIAATSYMISTCIDFIKQPKQDSFTASLDTVKYKMVKDHLLFTNLQKFNEGCASKELPNTLETLVRNHMKNFTGVEVGMWAAGVASVAIILNIVPVLRELVFFFFYCRTNISDYFDTQADLLQTNAYDVKHNSEIDPARREKIVKRQLKFVELFRKISNTFSVDCKKAEVHAEKDIAKATKKYKTREVLDSVPDSASGALF